MTEIIDKNTDASVDAEAKSRDRDRNRQVYHNYHGDDDDDDGKNERNRRSHHYRRLEDAKHGVRRHHGTPPGPGAQHIASPEATRHSAEGRAREKDRRHHRHHHGSHSSGSASRGTTARPADSKARYDGHHRRSSPPSPPHADHEEPMAEAQLASDREKELDDRLDRLEDVEKAYRDQLNNNNMGNASKVVVAVATDTEEKKSICNCSALVLVALVLLVLGAIAAGVWFLVFNKEDPSVFITVIYDPPSFQECLDIANGVPLDGQTTMMVESYNVAIDVHHSIVAEELPVIMKELDSMVQQSVMTTLAGCGDEYMLPDQNFVIASGSSDVTHQANESCATSTTVPSDGSCFQLVVHIDLYLKGQAPEETLLVWIEQSFNQDLANSDTLEVVAVTPVFELSNDSALTSEPTPNPTPRITVSPTVRPTTSLSPTVRPTTLSPTTPSTCFASKSELSQAINDWLGSTELKESVRNTYGPISQWCFTSDVTDMSYLFYQKESFNEDISSWDVSFVRNMKGMFRECKTFNQNLSTWNVSSVTAMHMMFHKASSFNGDISSWDVSSVTRLDDLFAKAVNFNQDISSWDVSSAIDMHSMFFHAVSFDGDVSSWNVSSAQKLSWMFVNASSFNQDLSRWDVSSATNMEFMFWDAVSFNQDISSWNVSSVTDMRGMFHGARSFNQDISAWNVSSVTELYTFVHLAVSFNQNLCAWGQKLPPNVEFSPSIFGWTACPTGAAPDFTNSPPGPFCHPCT